jgi:hypothetical protein
MGIGKCKLKRHPVFIEFGSLETFNTRLSADSNDPISKKSESKVSDYTGAAVRNTIPGI